MQVAVISSLYRFEAHLEAYTSALLRFARRVSQSEVAVHYLPIVNDATPRERQAIDQLARDIKARSHGRMTPRYVPRESLYASWNRGLADSEADGFGFWNADDIRHAEAFLDGCRALESGADLVDFDYTRVIKRRRLGLFPRVERLPTRSIFDPQRHTRANVVGPFFLARRSLYDAVGSFDEDFRIAGDTDWVNRARAICRFQRIPRSGGDFVLHGDNLSNSGSLREDIEVNIIQLRGGNWRELRPAEPAAMRQAWQSWGNRDGIELPAEQADYLWGAGAKARWQRAMRERRQPRLLRRLRLAMAARGWLHSEEWAAYQRGQGQA